MTVVNGIIQTARKTHVANTTLNLASNKKSVQFVRQWAKETTEQLNKIAACHSIQGFLVISSARSSGDLYIQGGSRMGVSFLNMLVCSGDPLRKFHTYVAGMSVAEELTGGEVTVCPTKTSQKRKHAKITGTQNVDGKTPKRDKYCLGTLKENKNTISKQLLAILRSAGVKKFWGWPGKNGARDLKAAHVTVQIKPNDDDFHAHELFQPINAIEIESSYRVLRAIGEGWIRLKSSKGDGDGDGDGEEERDGDGDGDGDGDEDGDGEDTPKGASGGPKRQRPTRKNSSRTTRKNLSDSHVNSDFSLENEELAQDESNEDDDFNGGNYFDE